MQNATLQIPTNINTQCVEIKKANVIKHDQINNVISDSGGCYRCGLTVADGTATIEC